jgi:hypothetical protein
MSNKNCSVCGISEDLTKFYYNSKYGTDMCNKHYLQIKNHGKIIDASQPNLDDKRIYWTPEDEKQLILLINKSTPFKEIGKILNRSRDAISTKIFELKIDTSMFYKNNINYSAIYQDYDWCYQKFMVEGLNHDEMAIEANSTKRVVEKWCTEKHRLTQKFRQQNKTLSELQRDLLIGSMLGDGHIDRREDQPMFIVAHAENQKGYLYYKYNILKDLCNIPPVRKEAYQTVINGGSCFCQPSYRFCTRIYDCLKEYRGKSYTYLLNLMNKYSFSVWMLDDGFRSRATWQLCVAEYTPSDINLAMDILKQKYNINAYPDKDIRYLDFDATSSRIIDQIILESIPNELDVIKYKITENNLSKPHKVLYVDENNKITLKEFCREHNLDYKYAWSKFNGGFDLNEFINHEVISV